MQEFWEYGCVARAAGDQKQEEGLLHSNVSYLANDHIIQISVKLKAQLSLPFKM